MCSGFFILLCLNYNMCYNMLEILKELGYYLFNDVIRLEMFMNSIKKVVESFFEYGEQIVVGVSGGADSMVLLHALKSSNKNFNLIVAHLNHCLRGEESKRDEKFVYEFCLKNNIKFVCKREDILKKAQEEKISIEECGRKIRYKFFEEFLCTVATAHTLSDVCETFFLNILRGCALKGLLSIPQKRGKIIRPLLTFKRQDILDYCKENNLKFVEDSSNFKEIYLRNKLRLNVIPKLKEINENFENNLLKTLNIVKQDEDFLEDITKKEFEKAKVNFGLDVKYINSLHKSIKSRIIVKFLKYNNFSLTNDLVVKIFNLCSRGFGREQISKNIYIAIKRGILIVEEDFNFKPFKILLDGVEFFYKNLYFIICDIKKYEYFLNKTNYLFLFRFDYDKINGKVYLKSREEKDSLKLLNRPTKTLKALMQEKGMTKNEKNEVVLLEDSVGVFWAFGFGGNPRVFPDKNTKTLCLIFEKL